MFRSGQELRPAVTGDSVARYPLARPVTRPHPTAREGEGVAPTRIWQEIEVERARRGQMCLHHCFKIQVLLYLGLARPPGQGMTTTEKAVCVHGASGNRATPCPTRPHRDTPGSGSRQREGEVGGASAVVPIAGWGPAGLGGLICITSMGSRQPLALGYLPWADGGSGLGLGAAGRGAERRTLGWLRCCHRACSRW